MTSRTDSAALETSGDSHLQPAPPSALLARLFVLGATVLWSTSGIFTKAPWLDIWPIEQRGLQLAFWRALFAGMVLLPFVRRISFPPLLWAAAICFAAMNASFLMAMTMTTAANAIWLQYVAPAWVFLVGVCLLGERWSSSDLLMLVMALLGVAVILIFEWRNASGLDLHLQGSLWGIVSGLTFAGVVLCVRGLRGHDSAWLIAVCQLVSATALAPYVVWANRWPDATTLTAVFLFGALQMALPYVLFAWGTRVITGHEASFIALLEPLLVPLWVYLIWGRQPDYQPPAIWTFAGGALIVTGLVIRYGPSLWGARPSQRWTQA